MQNICDVYISFDVETNGPVPGPFSMLSIGCAAFEYPKKMVGTFERNLETLPDAGENLDTMNWWKGFPEAYAATRENTVSPESAMIDLLVWSKSLGKKTVFAAYPAGFDFTFLYWYMVNFTTSNSFAFSCVDMKTYAMALMKSDYRRSSKKYMPKHWFDPDKKHTHGALDDAIEQGATFMNMITENLLGGQYADRSD